MKRISKQIREGFESITPDILPSILSDCKEAQDDAIPFQEKKTAPLILRIVASAAVLALLVGVGALAGGLFRRPSNLNPTTEETQPPTLSAEDELLLTAFCEATDMNFDEVKDKAIVRHYWDLGDLHFFYVDNLSVYPEKMNSIELLNKEFIFGTEQPLYMYKNGVCIDFMTSDYNTAFEILTNDSLNAFYHFHKAENETLYDPGNWPAKTDLDCPAHLSAEKRVELEATLGITAFNTDDQWYGNIGPCDYRYYGTYEGYDVVFQQTWQAAVTTKTIAGQAFTHGSSFILYAHKDGNLLMLSDVYEDGLISKESIVAAREYHNQCTLSGMISTCRPHPINKEHEEAIQQNWAQISDEPFGTWYSEENPNGNWRVYAGFILFYAGGEQEERFTTIQIGNYSFSHPTTFQLYIYSYGEMRLVENTDNYSQYLTDKELAEAAAMHIEIQNAVFGENWQAQYEHDFENTVLREPTCSDPGEGINVCKDCGYTVSCDYPLKEHLYEHRAQEFATCQNTGINKVTCRVCGDSYLEETPKTDHRWDNKHTCNSLVKCEYCDALHDPMHSAPVYGTGMEPTADRAGLRTNYCQWCREYFHEIWGNTGDYMLYVIQFKAAQYAESLGFTYEEAFPQTPYKEYEYMELYSVVESNGGQDALLQKAYELIDQLYDDACNSTAGSTAPYTIWISIMYLTDKNYSIGAFQIHAFIA